MADDVKYCQSCIERYNGKQVLATREWQPGIFYCDDCFSALLNNMTELNPESVKTAIPALDLNKPLLNQVYDYFKVPDELRFNNVDKICNARDKFFNFRAPAIVNLSMEDCAQVIEELSCTMFVVKYMFEPHQLQISKLKEEKRKEKNLSNLDESKEAYSKPKRAVVDADTKKKASMAKLMGITVEELEKRMAEQRKKDFDRLVNGGTEPPKKTGTDDK